jgi:sterol desaturase/sphingolipid hydroxylase (fatty acid hydroxylase superfamily)
MKFDLVQLSIPAFILLVVAEALVSALDKRGLYEAKDTFSSLAMGVGNVLTGLLSKAMVMAAYVAVYQFRLLDFGYAWSEFPSEAYLWVILFFAEDFSYYWFHRVSHTSRYFWASHVVHHSSQRYNLSTALRQTWTGNFSGSFVFWLWLPLLGFPPLMIGTLQSISLLYQFWIHTELIGKLPRPFEWLLNTPSHHRVHHASDLKYLDKNHGGILIVWDRLFGTFQEEEEKPVYGLTRNIHTFNPLRIAFHEWADLLRDLSRPGLSWGQRLRYLFMPPGWSHDGSRKTVREMRQAAKPEGMAGR